MPRFRMPNVFLSYRRRESSGYSRHVYERLAGELGAGNVFLDVAEIDPGVDWRAALRARIDTADTVLALIGKQWLDLRDEVTGQRRIDDPQDVTWVRSAMRGGKPAPPIR